MVRAPLSVARAALWSLVEDAKARGGDCMAALEARQLDRATCLAVRDELYNVLSALRTVIEEHTQIRRESGEGSVFGGVHVSLGGDDGFTDFLSYLLSRDEGVCQQVLADPESMVPPRNWEFFDVRMLDMLQPCGEEGFLQYALEEYLDRPRRR